MGRGDLTADGSDGHGEGAKTQKSERSRRGDEARPLPLGMAADVWELHARNRKSALPSVRGYADVAQVSQPASDIQERRPGGPRYFRHGRRYAGPSAEIADRRRALISMPTDGTVALINPLKTLSHRFPALPLMLAMV